MFNARNMGPALALVFAAAAFAQPANDNCGNAQVIAVGTTAFDNSAATLDGGTNCGFNLGKDVWYTFTPSHAGNYFVSTCGGAAFDTVLTAYDGCGGNVLACNDDNCALQSRIELPNLAANVPITIQLSSYNNNAGGSGTLTLGELLPIGNDNCADAQAIVGNSVSGDNSGATLDGSTDCGFNTGKDVWYTYIVPAAGDYIVETCNGAFFDTVLSAFDGCGGSVLACNDDNCGLQSSIEVDGLSAGQMIWIRLASYNNNAGGPFTINISVLGPTDPTGFGDVNPNPAFPGDVVQMTVSVTPGLRPDSTGLAVSGDLSVFGGATNATFYDDGTNGDDFAGDNVFSRLVTIPANFSGSTYSVPFVITDAQSRSGSGTINGNVSVPAQWQETSHGDAGDLPATAQVPTGTDPFTSIGGTLDASDSDMFKIRICDPSNFSAATDSPDTTGDTQLWLFSEDGHGVQFNDDAVGTFSAMQNQFVSAAGTYYLGISQYNRDATDEFGQLIWNNTPFAGVRAPDGVGAANTIAGWTGGTGGLNYRINLTGVCFAGCSADFNGDSVVDFFDYLDFVQAFAGNQASADFNHDSVIDFFDYLDFVQAFAAGC